MKRSKLAERRRLLDERAAAAEKIRAELRPGEGQCEHLHLLYQCPYCRIEELRREASVAKFREAALRVELRRLRARLGDDDPPEAGHCAPGVPS